MGVKVGSIKPLTFSASEESLTNNFRPLFDIATEIQRDRKLMYREASRMNVSNLHKWFKGERRKK